MEFLGTTSQVLDHIKNASAIKETKASQMAGLVRLPKASDTAALAIIKDVAEISQKAMNKLLSEKNG